jgi:hypothetical protein
MAEMANKSSRNPLVYDQLSFLEYDCECPRLDTEWLLSTLFDASLLSTSKAADLSAALFLALPPARFGRLPHHPGNHKTRCGWTPAIRTRNDLFIISRRLKMPGLA